MRSLTDTERLARAVKKASRVKEDGTPDPDKMGLAELLDFEDGKHATPERVAAALKRAGGLR